MNLPSALNLGDAVGRSSGTTNRAAPPATGTSASRSWLYALYFGSTPRTKAIVAPSGLQAQGQPSGPANVVRRRAGAPKRASTTKTSELFERSGSPSTRLLSNA